MKDVTREMVWHNREDRKKIDDNKTEHNKDRKVVISGNNVGEMDTRDGHLASQDGHCFHH